MFNNMFVFTCTSMWYRPPAIHWTHNKGHMP